MPGGVELWKSNYIMRFLCFFYIAAYHAARADFCSCIIHVYCLLSYNHRFLS